MSGGTAVPAFDWRSIRLVVFDVDGTLYDQGRLRRRMAVEIALHCCFARSAEVIRVLGWHRRLRERLAERECEDFEVTLLSQTAERTGLTEARIRELIAEWIERRPLRRLAACRYEKLPALFAGLRASGKIVGVLSDYPAAAKLEALGLCADHVVWAGDDGVGVMKPHPRGLELLMARANKPPENTVLIGDRIDRDGFAAARAGARCLIRSAARPEGWTTFAHYGSALFAPVLAGDWR